MQAKYVKQELRCFFGTAPSLTRVARVYGDEIAESWIEIQLHDLSVFAGCKDKMEVEQLESTAKAILYRYGKLKVTELMVFFQRFKAGLYGRFYGVVDGLVITSALNEFLQYRLMKLNEATGGSEETRDFNAYEEYLKFLRDKEKALDSGKNISNNNLIQE